MLIISYYTENTPYKKVIEENLLPTLKKFNLDYHIEAVPDLGTWHKNTAIKPQFIYSCLLKFKQDLIFTDADSQIEQNPILFDQIPQEFDIAVHYLDWYLHWRNKKGDAKRELLSGTMMFRYNEKVLELTKKYIEETQKNINTLEQLTLQKVLENTPDIKIYNLPVEYCAVLNHSNELPDYINEPFITHHQASRIYKKRR